MSRSRHVATSRRPRHRRGAFTALLTASLLVAGASPNGIRSALAGETETAAAVQKFEEGKKAFDGGSFDQAILAFKASDALLPSPNSKLYLGRSYRALGKVASAYTALHLAALEAQDRLTATGEKRYGATRDAAAAEASAIEPKLPRLLVVVPGGLPEGFRLTENGEDLPKAAWGVATETDPGTVTVEANAPRIVPFKQVVTLTEGGIQRVEVDVKKMPTALLTVALKTRPAGVSIVIDGAPVDSAAVDKPREVDVGEHAVTVEAPGYVPFRWTQPLADGDKATVDVTLKADARALAGKGTPKWLFVTTSAGAVALLGAATGIAIDAWATSNAQQGKPAVERDPSDPATIRGLSTAANVLFIGGGALAVAAGILGFTTSWHGDASKPAQAVVSPWFSPGGGGAGITGRF